MWDVRGCDVGCDVGVRGYDVGVMWDVMWV